MSLYTKRCLNSLQRIVALSCCRKNTPKTLNLRQIMQVQKNNLVQDQDGNSSKPLLTTVALSEIEDSNRNGMDWFNSYQDIDNFLFDELDKKGLEFITEFEKPELNTIASIKLLMCNCG